MGLWVCLFLSSILLLVYTRFVCVYVCFLRLYSCLLLCLFVFFVYTRVYRLYLFHSSIVFLFIVLCFLSHLYFHS